MRVSVTTVVGPGIMAGRDPEAFARYLAVGWRGTVHVSPVPEPEGTAFVFTARTWRRNIDRATFALAARMMRHVSTAVAMDASLTRARWVDAEPWEEKP